MMSGKESSGDGGDEDFRCSLSLKDIQRELKELTDIAHRNIDIDESRYDYLLKAQELNEEYQEMAAEEKAHWRESVFDFAQQCQERTRTFIPVNIFESSLEDLVELGLTVELGKRILQRQCLWLVRMSPAEISRLHDSDLLGRYNSSAQGMDIIETAAIYASLPDRFMFDRNGKKTEWRDNIEENLRQMLLDNDNDELPDAKIRHPDYNGMQFGPVEDIESVRENRIVSSAAYQPRRSFLEVCKNHSILSMTRGSSGKDAVSSPTHQEEEEEEDSFTDSDDEDSASSDEDEPESVKAFSPSKDIRDDGDLEEIARLAKEARVAATSETVNNSQNQKLSAAEADNDDNDDEVNEGENGDDDDDDDEEEEASTNTCVYISS